MEAKRRGKRTHARKGTKAARRAAAKKGWAKRRRERKKFVGPMRRGYTRAAEARRKPRRRHRRAREVAEVSESRRGRGRRHHRKSRMFEARGGKRGAGDVYAPDGMTLDQIEKCILDQALTRCQGNRTLTAEKLGLSRRTIQRKIKEHNLPF